MQAEDPQSPGAASAAAPTLASLLHRWGRPAAPAAPLAERLGGLLGWADAIRLSQALAVPPAALPGQTPQAALNWAQAALERLRAEVQAAIADPELAAESAEAQTDAALPLADLLAPYRLHHAQVQRAIAARVASLRERLRVQLTETGRPRLLQLAALDAVFDPPLGAAQAQRLTALPTLLGQRAHGQHAADPRGWRRAHWADLQQALLAELDLRLQPVLGLIEALHPETE